MILNINDSITYFLALIALVIGAMNLLSKKGTNKHKLIGWF